MSKIRSGQIWRSNTTGTYIRIGKPSDNGYWISSKLDGKNPHKIHEGKLIKSYSLVSDLPAKELNGNL